MGIEGFVDVEGFEGLYKVNNQGIVLSFKGPNWERKGPLVIKHSLDKNGYHKIGLNKNGKMHNKAIHRLVLETFMCKCPKGMQGCHNNGDKSDNRIENLRWDTAKNNSADRISHGNQVSGENQHSAKLNVTKVKEIKILLKTESGSSIARKYGVSKQAISFIKTGRNWSFV